MMDTYREREREIAFLVYLKEGSSPSSGQLSKQHDFNFSDSDNERGEVGTGGREPIYKNNFINSQLLG